jgi:hypothetical protein
VEKQTYTIAGKTVTAEFDIEDYRDPREPACYGNVEVNATVAVDGKSYPVGFQPDDNYELRLFYAHSGRDEDADKLLKAIYPALDLDAGEGYDQAMALIAPIIEGAQHAYDVHMCVLNDVDEPVEGIELRCGCALSGTWFECKGDGYVTVRHAPGFQRTPDHCYAIDEITAAALREIEETTSADHERTQAVFDLMDEIPMVRAVAQTQARSR